MSLLVAAACTVGAGAFAAAALAAKLRRDAIVQDGARVGSTLLAGVAQEGEPARFVIVRGEAAFRQDAPFEHRGRRFQLISYESYDDRSPVLRRFLAVTCRVLAKAP